MAANAIDYKNGIYYDACNSYEDRVLVAMDLRNVSTFLKDNTDTTTNDYRVLLDNLIRGRRALQPLAFDSVYFDSNEDRSKGFHEMIKRAGFRLSLVQMTNDCGKQGIVDVHMALKIMKMAMHSRIDVVELVTGDGDLTPLVEELQEMGIRVNVSAFHDCFNKVLVEKADNARCIDNIPLLRMGPATEGIEGVSQ